MSASTGRKTLEAIAPLQARALAALEAGVWNAAAQSDRAALFETMILVVSAQHGLKPLARKNGSTASDAEIETAREWRRIGGLDGADLRALEFAEQTAFDVSSVQTEQREALFGALGGDAAGFAQAVYAADMLPRARAALDALFGESDWSGFHATVTQGDASSLTSDVTLQAAVDEIIRVVPALQAIDPVTTEIVRMLGAKRHQCRVCQSVRSFSALEAGANDSLLDSVEDYRGDLYDACQQAALAFTDGFIASPARFEPATTEALRDSFGEAACVELILDLTRNATNKIAVALGGDAPRVEVGYEIYDVRPDGEITYGLNAPGTS